MGTFPRCFSVTKSCTESLRLISDMVESRQTPRTKTGKKGWLQNGEYKLRSVQGRVLERTFLVKISIQKSEQLHFFGGKLSKMCLEIFTFDFGKSERSKR